MAGTEAERASLFLTDANNRKAFTAGGATMLRPFPLLSLLLLFVFGIGGCWGDSYLDSDLDGVPDDLDGCPYDPDKTSPGACGCNQPEIPDCGRPPPEDDHPDSFSRATVVTVGASIAGNIEVPGDVDYFSFSAQQGWSYVIETYGTTDTFLTLFGTDGLTELASDDDSGDGMNARIEWTGTASGTYYIRVRHFLGGTGEYWLSVAGTPPPAPPPADSRGTLVVNANPADPLIAILEKNGQWLMLTGEKSANGEIVDLYSVTYRVSPTSDAFTLSLDNDGLLSHALTRGWTFYFSNWRNDRVDCMIITPAGGVAFVEDVRVAPGCVTNLRDLWASGSASQSSNLTSLGTARISGKRTLGWAVKFGAYALDVFSCVGGVASGVAAGAAAGGVGAVPGAIAGFIAGGCPDLILTAYADLSGNEAAGQAATALGVLECTTLGDLRSCASTGMHVWSDELLRDYESHQSTLNTFNSVTGRLRGNVRDARTRSPLSGARVRVLRQQQVVSSSLTDSNGRYEVLSPAGIDYRLEVTKDGYVSVTYFGAEVAARQTSELETLLQIESRFVGTGTISGTVANALNGSPVAGAAIRFRQGQNARQGSVVFSTTTDSAGHYQLSSVQSGIYTGEVAASGFLTGYFTVMVLGGMNVGDQNVGLSPQLASGGIRIVLTWGAYPYDLDSHLTGPASDGSRFHVYYADLGRSDGEPYAALDHDDTSSYGPETITIYRRRGGTYRYTVHDFLNRWSSSSWALANSSAEVKVYSDAGLVATFSVPPSEGTAWTVFELDGNSGTITPINVLSYVFDPSEIAQRAKVRTFYDLDLLEDLPAK